MTIVLDASALVAALLDSGPVGRWADGLLDQPIYAPTIVHAEVTNVLRRTAARGSVSDDVASLAHADLMALSITIVDHADIAARVWELRHNLSAFDASYVAVAELTGAPLATLDGRIVRSTGPTCVFSTPPDVAGSR